MKKIKTITALVLVVAMLSVTMPTLFANGTTTKENVDTAIKKEVNYLYNELKDKIGTTDDYGNIIGVGASSGEWTISNFARSGVGIKKEYYDKYYSLVEKTLKENNGVFDRGQVSDYARLVLALTAMNKDVTNVGGVNLLEKLADFNNIKDDYILTPVFVLLALDSKNYEVPVVAGVTNPTTREKLVDLIVSKQKADGAFDDWASKDTAAITIAALNKYKKTNTNANAAIDKTVTYLANDYASSTNGVIGNIYSMPYVILGLTEVGVNVNTDSRFIKNGESLLDTFLKYQRADGGFTTTIGETTENRMLTEQAGMALVSYNRMLDNKNSYFNMSDSNNVNMIVPTPPTENENPGTATNNNDVVILVMVIAAIVSATVLIKRKKEYEKIS